MGDIVTYWPSTEPSIKKQMHPVEDITLTCGWVEFGADTTPTRSRWMSNNYITGCHRRLGLVGLTSHTQPFRNPFENKVWEVYFSKEVCSFVIIVDYVSAYICIRIVVSRLYNPILVQELSFVLSILLNFWKY